MNEEIEYAEMLEIPVSTVNVIRKNAKKRSKPIEERTPERASFAPSAENDTPPFATFSNEYFEGASEEAFPSLENAEASTMYGMNEENFPELSPISRAEKIRDIVLKAEFGVACALCLGIFLTNVWMPHSAINTFFRSLTPESNEQAVDERDYKDFTLSSILGEGSDAEMTLSPTGILTFTDVGCVYPTADGKVSALTKDENGKYTVTIAHTDSFSGVIEGLDYVYYEIGQSVKHNVPVGYSEGENEVKVTMYSDGNLLNCFSVTEENALAWVTEAE